MHRYIGWPYYAKEVGVALMKLSERPEYKSRVDDGILNYFDLSGQMVDEIIKVYPQTSFSPFKSLNELIDLYLQHPSNWYLYYSFIKLDYKNFAYPTIIMKMFYLLQNPKDYYKIDRLAELGINLGLDLDHKLSDIRNCYWDYKKLSDEWSKVHKPIKPADNYGIEYKGVIKFHGRYFGMLQQNVIAESDSKYFWLNGLHFVHNEFINEYVERTGQVVEFRYGRKSKTAEVLRLSDEQTYLDDIEEYQRQLKEAGQQYANTKAEFNRQMAEYENSKPYYESRLQELLGRFNNLVTELYSQI
jgi:FtsZ-binding cell division protein ZapB